MNTIAAESIGWSAMLFLLGLLISTTGIIVYALFARDGTVRISLWLMGGGNGAMALALCAAAAIAWLAR